MEVKQLRIFLQVAELGSLSKASSRMNLVQPALSRQVRLLEEELQVQLFTRHGRGMTLTDAGLLLRERAKVIVRQLEDTKADLADQAVSVRGSVSLGLPPTVGDVLGARLIAKYHARYPEVRLRVIGAFSGYLLDFLNRGEVDLAITYAVDQRLTINLTPLIIEDLFLVGTRQPEQLTEGAASFATVASLPLVLPGTQHGLRVIIGREARAAGISLDVQVEADSLQTLKDLVVLGLGYTILPFASFAREAAQGLVVATPIISPRISRTLMLAQPLGRPISNAVRLFATMLQQEVVDMVEGKVWTGQLAK